MSVEKKFVRSKGKVPLEGLGSIERIGHKMLVKS